MTLTVTLGREYAAVIVSLLSSVVVDSYLGAKVGRARKEFGVPLPYLYADSSFGEKGKRFNCVQRGHMNTVEKYPIYIILQVLSSFEYPLISAGLGMTYHLGRILYFNGYAAGNPSGRSRGFFG
ncbi:hypothetical protein HDU93_007918 [Gonapodya sp. JEL0774]|nr:hypothetical protein HDU93_007918 [Gonapodya sp. JEL0774]